VNEQAENIRGDLEWYRKRYDELFKERDTLKAELKDMREALEVIGVEADNILKYGHEDKMSGVRTRAKMITEQVTKALGKDKP